MTPKERMYAAIEGRQPDILPVAASYVMLSNADHWEELTGLPVWKYYEWSLTADMGWYREISRLIYGQLPFDVVQPMVCNHNYRGENIAVVEKGGKHFFHDKKKGTYTPVPETIHESGSGGGENETRYIFTKQDARERLKVVKMEQLIANGNPYLEETVKLYGDTHFILGSGIVNTFFSNVYHVGMMEFYAMLHEEPELVKYISELVLEQNIEYIRAVGKSGSDAMFIDDATATSDMISVRMYEEFSLPYMIEQVKEIKRQGMKAFVIYFGGISDRVEQIASTGADVLMMETSMKGYVNDYTSIARRLGGQICLAGNLDPYGDIELLSDEGLEARMTVMAKAGREYGRYFTCTGSPLTPKTPLKRIQKYIDIGHRL